MLKPRQDGAQAKRRPLREMCVNESPSPRGVGCVCGVLKHESPERVSDASEISAQCQDSQHASRLRARDRRGHSHRHAGAGGDGSQAL
eukprot:344411-Prorocentrum_lima.AAC.1